MTVFKPLKLEKYLLRNYNEKFAKRFRRLFFVDGNLQQLQQECQLEKVYKNNLSIYYQENSKIDGATKIILKTYDNHLVEMVILRIKTGRVTLCISSQVGCTEKCTFCATGQLKFQRNLTTAEMCEQVVIARQIILKENKKLRNIVFMGMGEPLRNFENVTDTLSLLTSDKHFAFSMNHITISTLGVADKIIPLIKKFPKIQLALSLNASNDKIRQKIMPINQQWNMQEIQNILKTLSKEYNKQTFIEYILFQDVNDSERDALQIVSFLKDIQVKVNLIPYNYNKHCNLSPSNKKTIEKFKNVLQGNSLNVTIRYSLGQDIKAACGQLAKTLQK